jgi:hypothetical protein
LGYFEYIYAKTASLEYEGGGGDQAKTGLTLNLIDSKHQKLLVIGPLLDRSEKSYRTGKYYFPTGSSQPTLV